MAGVHIDQVGGRGGTGSLYLRGADPNYTLVLVDGVRVNDPTNARGGSFDFSTFDIADVERVEIARGPYSAVYGGDALAGVVNIVTRRAPRETHARATLDAMGGAYDTHELALRAGGPIGARRLERSAPATAHEGEVVRGNHFDWQRVSGSLDYGARRRHHAVRSPARYAETDARRISRRQRRLRVRRHPRHREARRARSRVRRRASITRVGDATFALTVGYFDRDDHIDSPGVAPGIRDPFGVPPSVVDTGIAAYSPPRSPARRSSPTSCRSPTASTGCASKAAATARWISAAASCCRPRSS